MAILPLAVIAGCFLQMVGAAPLTRDQVAQHAYTAGFRGGALVAAIAVAESESAFEPLAVANNYHRCESTGTKLYQPDGKPVILTYFNTVGSLIPLDGQVHFLFSRSWGIPLHHCRGLWQINDLFNASTTDAQAFDPATAAARAYYVSRGGRHWWKWTTVMNGLAWDPTRWSAARTAAATRDPLVLPASPVGLRAEAHLRGGWIYDSLGGTRIRQTRAGDTGTILSGPVLSTITDGVHTSQHPMLQVSWDSGVTGWCAEQFLRRSNTSPAQAALAAFDPAPAHLSIRIGYASPLALGWTRGANTASMSLRFGTSPSLSQGSDLKLSNTLATTWTMPALAPYTNYYWRVDSLSGNGTLTQGVTWTFRTEPLPALPVSLTNLTLSQTIFPTNRTITIAGYAFCSGAQSFLLGASWTGPGGPVSNPANDAAITTPANGTGAPFSRTFTLPASGVHAGIGTILVSPWRDLNGDGKISKGDHQICLSTPGDGIRNAGSVTLLDANPPIITNFTVSPAAINAGSPVTIHLSGTDDAFGLGLGRVRVHYISPAGHPWLIFENLPGNAPAYSTSFTHTPQHASQVSYRLELLDGTFSNSAVSGQIPVQVTDRSPPVVVINSPAQGAVFTSSYTLVSGIITDFSTIQSLEYRIDGAGWAPLTAGNNFSFNPDFSAGHHSIEIRASDSWLNRSAPVTREIYVRPSDTDTTSFDQWLTFSGSEVPVQWTADFQSSSGSTAGLINQRLYAGETPSLAALHRTKAPPAWASSVETDLIMQDQGLLIWSDNSVPPQSWQVGLSTNNGTTTVTYGKTTSLLSRQFPSNYGDSKVRVTWQSGRMDLRVVTPGNQSQYWTQSAPGLALPNLREMRLETSPDFAVVGSSSIDSVLIRALRFQNEFQVREFTRSTVPNDWQVLVATWPDRLYAVETSTNLNQPWTVSHPFYPDSNSGVLNRQNIYIPANTPRIFVRVRELP
ncbi:MAG: hypothetical protein K9N23_21805 [Akkermansiaceae bacterium]|nr:hypothetical protein [Akkermansiaceae bacterium]